jgi:two-component system, cell cycle sensor histidine kinase and response regulator CckA
MIQAGPPLHGVFGPTRHRNAAREPAAGGREEDYFLIRDALNRHNRVPMGNLDHAHSIDEVQSRLDQAKYDLVIFQYESSDQMMAIALERLRQQGRTMPFLILAEGAKETDLVKLVDGGTCEFVARDEVGHESFLRAIRTAANLHRRQEQVRSTEQMLRKLHSAVEQSADMVMITDAAGHIEYVNPAFEQTTGYSRAEVMGATPRVLKSGEHGPEFYAELWRVLKAGEVYRGVLINRKKTGESIVVEKTITPVRDARGRITNYIANDRDISERRQLETALFQAQKMDAIGQLAGGIAHDFNNLLMVISSYAELLLDHMEPGKPRRHVEEIQGAARRAAELTHQLLAFGRKQAQQLQNLDLNQMLAEVARTLPRLIGEDIELKLVPGTGLGQVRLDPVQFEQVLMNLAANARDAMPGGGRLTLESRGVELDSDFLQARPFVPPGRYVLLEVTDSGTGIPPEHLPHIFEPFYTTKAQGKGTGLGLATVYGIVKQSGGFIWVYSDPGLGTTFKIYFPEVRNAGVASLPAAKLEAKSPPRGSETILMVEDEEAVRHPSCEFLRQSGYTVLEAANGQAALAMVETHAQPIHLVIADVVMPVMSGRQLAERLSRSHPETRVLFISGYAEDTVKDHQILDLRSNLLQKPFGLRQLAGKIREVLTTRPAACIS